MQLNVGLRCNLACRHCHVAAGPSRTEVMERVTMQRCLEVYDAHGFETIDITGGAPELNPSFVWLLEQAHARRARTIVRSNLVILGDPAYAHLPELFARLGVVVVASLPHYTKDMVEKQRGDGAFDPAIAMLQRLCDMGYGRCEDLELNLVYNPLGAFLPPDQHALEQEYRQKLDDDFGIAFSNLFVITNNPLGRFGERLQQTGNLDRYMTRLVDAFNPETVPRMMCRTQLSVGWDGLLYDCDFNQAAGMPCADGRTIADMAAHPEWPLRRAISFGNHCYACCAGAGSS